MPPGCTAAAARLGFAGSEPFRHSGTVAHIVTDSTPQHCAVQASGLQMNVSHCCFLSFVSTGAVLSEV
jgi:hypothetical protein